MVTTTTGIATSFIQFSRASNATVTNNVGNIAWAGHNLLTNSESFDAAAWSKTYLTVAANVIAAPNGTTTVDQFLETATAGVHFSGQSVTAPAGQYTFAVYAKPSGRNFVGLYNAELSVGKIFDISTGAVGSDITAAPLSASVTSVGSGWYRCEIVVNATLTTTNWRVYICESSSSFSYTGDITKGIYAWGASLYRSDLGGMVYNPAQPAGFGTYYPTTPKNLLGYTEDFSNAAWTKASSTIIANIILAPNGLQTADKIVATNSASTTRGAYQSVTPVSGGRYVASVYAKAAEYDKLTISEIGAGRFGASFNLTAQTATSLGGAGYVSSDITSVGDGWFRCSVVWTASTAAAITFVGYPTGATLNAAGTSYAGDGISGIYLWGAQLSDSASIDPYSPNYGAAPTASAYYAPRLDYSPTTIQPLGMLVEEQRTNLMVYSNDMTQGIWTAYSSALVTTANSALGPDGKTSANTITLSANARVNFFSVTSSTTYTVSVWLRTDTGTKNVTIGDLNDVSSAYTTVTVDTTWRRYTHTYTKSALNSSAYVGIFQNFGTSPSTSGTLYAWGWQYEAGSFATSYIPTGASTVTRSVDIASVSTQAFPYSATEGTLVVSGAFISLTASSVAVMASLNNNNSTNSVNIYRQSAVMQLNSFSGGTNTVTYSVSASTEPVKAAIAYKLNDANAAVNGVAQTTDTTAALPVGVDRLDIGWMWSVYPGNGWIRQVTYLPRRISNAELQTRTTL